MSDFHSAYAQGFARVAACTLPVRIADPAANARAVMEQVEALPRARAWRSRSSPSSA